MQEVSILFFLDSRLNFVESLFHELAILHIEDTIGVALNLRVMRHHYACRSAMLTLALRSNAVDVQNQVHDSNYYQSNVISDKIAMVRILTS